MEEDCLMFTQTKTLSQAKSFSLMKTILMKTILLSKIMFFVGTDAIPLHQQP